MKSYFSTNRVLAWTIASVAIATLFFACKKSADDKAPIGPGDPAPTNEVDNNTIAAASHEAKLNAIYADLFETVYIASESHGTTRQRNNPSKDMADAGSCPEIGIDNPDGTTWPKTMTVIYGGSCLDNFGVTRSGTVTITLSGPLFKPGTVALIKLENYKVQGIPVTGTATINMISFDNTTGVQYSIEITGGKVIYGDTLIMGYSSKRTIKQTEGGATRPNRADDVYSIEGNATITYEKGGPEAGAVATFTTVIPLIKSWKCNFVSKGQLKVTYNKVTGIIDYGTGICDNKAVITVGDKAKEIDLSK